MPNDPIPAEIHAVQSGAAIHDRRAYGRFVMAGKDRITVLHKLTTNEVRSLPTGAGVSTVFTTDKGRIVDLVTVLFRAEDQIVVTSPALGERVMVWLGRFVIREKVTFTDLASNTDHVALLGPRAPEALRQATSIDVAAAPEWHHVEGPGDAIAWKGERYLDCPCINVLGPSSAMAGIRAQLLAAGAELLSEPSFELCRILSGIPKNPTELNDDRNPWEAKLDASISLVKGCYIGQEVVARLDTYKKVHRGLARFHLDGRATLAPGERMAVTRDGREVGFISSLALDPGTGRCVGLGYITGDLEDGGLDVEAAGLKGKVEGVKPWGRAQGA